MACRPTSLTKRRGKPATAVVVSCAGPGGAPGLTYKLSVSVPRVRKAVTTVKVRFPRATFSSLKTLVAAAPLPTLGSMVSRVYANGDRVSFLRPTGWSRTDTDDATHLSVAEGPITCDVFVFHHIVPDLTGSTRAQQEHSAMLQLLAFERDHSSVAVNGEYGNPNALVTRRSGTNGYGFPWVGLTLEDVNGNVIYPYLVVFGRNFAVPVIQVGTACGPIYRFGAQTLAIAATMAVPGSTPHLTGYAKPLLGRWFGGSSGVGVLDAYAANGHYVNAGVVGGTVVIGGYLYDVTYSFVGDGNYAAVGPVLATFPTRGRASSSLVSIYDEWRGDQHDTRLCKVSRNYDGSIGSLCQWR
jgi:hypothetical protein